ncbi:DUF4870 domain-containing protein [Candidatus Curtissbacteria bacterium]|nr:DUF4870 domain-containing protein [Candidatus Curtissbacteria bacterium]
MNGNRNTVAAICYLLGFITAAVVIFTEDRDKFIRFHAYQSLYATGALFVLNMVVGLVLGKVGLPAILVDLTGVVIWLLILVVCVVGFVSGWKGDIYKFPLVGNIAEKKANS